MAEEGRDLAAIYDAMTCGVVVRDAAGAIVFANAAAHRIFGRPPDELAGHDGGPTDTRRVREDGTAMPDDEVPNVAARDLGQPVRNVTMGLIRSDGYVRWLLIDAVPIFGSDGGVREVVSSFTDVTDRKKAEGELERQTLQDQLTGLPNRTLLVDRLDQALRSSRRFATPLALLVMDLDGFKEINDSFGHQAGDHLLREVRNPRCTSPNELRADPPSTRKSGNPRANTGSRSWPSTGTHASPMGCWSCTSRSSRSKRVR